MDGTQANNNEMGQVVVHLLISEDRTGEEAGVEQQREDCLSPRGCTGARSRSESDASTAVCRFPIARSMAAGRVSWAILPTALPSTPRSWLRAWDCRRA